MLLCAIMKVDITPLLSEIGQKHSFSLNKKLKIDLGDDVKLISPVKLQSDIFNSGAGLVAKGELQATLLMVCGVCLKEFEEKIKVSFEERFISETENVFPDEAEYEVKDTDIFFTYDSNLVIDFSEMIRELIILNLPISPKCDINCQVKIQDEDKVFDERLAVLANLKKKMEDTNGCTKEKDD
jgi:uncharacterized metal-binding protein YceD (DUF177 family)